MSDFRTEAVDELFLRLNQDDLASIVKDVLHKIGKGETKKSIGQVKHALAMKILGGTENALLVAQRGQNSVAALDKEIRGRIEMKQLDLKGKKDIAEAVTESEKDILTHRTDQQIRVLREKADIANPKVMVPDEVKPQADALLQKLTSHLKDVESQKMPLMDQKAWSELNGALAQLGEPYKSHSVTLDLQRNLASQQASAQTEQEIVSHFAPKGGLNPDMASSIKAEAARTGLPQTPASHSFKLVEQAIEEEKLHTAKARAAGVTLTPEGEVVEKGIWSKLFGDRAASNALFKKIPGLRLAGDTAGANTALDAALAARKGSGWAKLGVGGALAAVLLPMILGKKENPQEDIPLPLKIQLMQTMASQQQQGALVQSLVGSRGAEAEKNQAQAELLRLKAMSMMGQGGGSIL